MVASQEAETASQVFRDNYHPSYAVLLVKHTERIIRGKVRE